MVADGKQYHKRGDFWFVVTEKGERKICGAKRQRKESRCHAPPMENGRCRVHGGMSPKGVASPHFKTGRYSKWVPERLQDKYQTALGDANLLSLRDELALVDARLAELLGRVDKVGHDKAWAGMLERVSEARGFVSSGNSSAALKILEEAEEALRRGVDDFAVWGEVNSQITLRARLAESERRRMVDLQQFVTAERAMMLIMSISETIKRHVTDYATLSAISSDIARLVGPRVGDEPIAVGE